MSRASSQPLTNPAASLIPSGSEESYAIRRSASERSSAPGALSEPGLIAFGDREERFGPRPLALGLVGRGASVLRLVEAVLGLRDPVPELAGVELVGWHGLGDEHGRAVREDLEPTLGGGVALDLGVG